MKVGAKRLLDYLEKNNIKPSHFARDIGKFPSTICRITTGENCPDIQTATDIEKYTKGHVKMAHWLQDIPVVKDAKASATSGSINRK